MVSSKKKILSRICMIGIPLIIVVFLSMVVIFFLTYDGGGEEYPWGRDTEYQFGDGRYQILREAASSYSFFDDSECIERYVCRYRDAKPYAYIVGLDGYTVVKYETREVLQEDYLEDMPIEYQKVFNETDRFWILKEGK